ncbi:type I polyketide synthase [Aspergillus lucknowensis]|uniref:Polyketide synthase n=1 Tax=Aspergillus lucknowensis TaxID=176173 RepID=A0ABR4LCE3_9EURO
MSPVIFDSGSSTERSSSASPVPSDIASDLPYEPIAICGIACRLPGEATHPRAFWDLLANGRTAQCKAPGSRFNVDGFYHPKGQDRPGSMMTEGGYFLNEDIREFENSFFGINNLEATYMDPAQRKLLEVVYECLENAGIPMEKASGSNTGCYVGNFTVDYMVMQLRDPDFLSRYSGTGLGTTLLGNRISHIFNLQGPSLVIDTACSSSLYCLHMACTALQNRECDAAVVAGANLIQSAEQHIATVKLGVLSPSSTCHTFDSSADGYGRADGIGALYVKRLKDALRDGDPIRSVVRSSAINANGRTPGISLPSADGQELVIRKAFARANISVHDINYVECHGTGTKVGDAIEVDALARVFPRAANQQPLLIGSVKSNVGHSEAASGISSVIKGTMVLEQGLIPGSYGVQDINPKLKAEERNIVIPTELTAWPDNLPRVRRLGVNSFGYGGANAHVILEQAPKVSETTTVRAPSLSAVVLPLSATTTASLEARVQDFAHFDYGTTDILDLAHTLASRRSQLPVRGFLVAPRSGDIATSFRTENFITAASPVTSKASTPFAFVFTGQGSQWPGMCRELFSDFAVFRHAIAEMDMVLRGLPNGPEWSLKDAILGDADKIHLPSRSQPCCTAIQVALIQLLSSWGMFPAATVGHSSGEIAAAYAAGYLSSAEAIAIAYYRGYCATKSTQDGAMMAVGLPEEEAAQAISDAGLEGQVRVACVNSPGAVTVSGDRPAVEELSTVLKEAGTFARVLKTGGQAYHSHHMRSIGGDYQALLEQVLPRLDLASRQPQGALFMSSVTGEAKTAGFSPSYWRQNLESQVRFAQAIDKMYTEEEGGPYCFIELGPHSTLELPIKQTLATAGVPQTEVQYAAPVKRNVNAVQSVLSFAGSLWLKGYEMDWSRIHGLQMPGKTGSSGRVVTDLPKYRFTYGEQPLWHETRASVEFRKRKYPRHELLGSALPGGNGRDIIYRNALRLEDVPWLADHRLGETIVFPGAGYLAMAMEAVMRATDTPLEARPVFEFSNVTITSAMVLDSDATAPLELFTSLRRAAITNAATSTTWWDFAISTYRDETTVQHSAGSIAIRDSQSPLSSRYKPSSSISLESTARRTWYERFVKQGLNYGDAFQTISEFQTPRMKAGLSASATAPLLTSFDDPLAVYPVHPITLDGMIQLAVVAAANGRPKELIAQVPTRLVSAVVHTAPREPADETTCHMHAVVERTGFGYIQAGLELSNKAGEPLVQVDQIRLAPYHSPKQSDAADDTRHPILRVLWKPDIHGLGFIEPRAAQEYLQGFAEEAHSPVSDAGLLKLGGVLDLLGHKDPDLRILEVGNDSHELTMAVLELLSFQSEFRRLRSYTTAVYSSDEGALVGGPVDMESGTRSEKQASLGGDNDKFDLILIPSLDEKKLAGGAVEALTSALSANGSILALGRESSAKDLLATSALSTLAISLEPSSPSSIIFSKLQSDPPAVQKSKFVIVERDDTETPLGSALADALRSLQGHSEVLRVPLHQLAPEHVPSGTTIFNLAELEVPLLATISDEDMARVKIMTDNAASLVWVTGGNIVAGGNPDFALISGLSRAVMLEQPALKFYTYDVDVPGRQDNAQVPLTAQRLASVLSQRANVPDLEFAQHNGVVHVSRFTPDEGLNDLFRRKQGLQATSARLGDVPDVRLALKQAGQLDSMYFQEQEAAVPGLLAPTEVRVKVASVGLNAKDYYVLVGQVDTPDASCQVDFAGTIVEVGSAVTEFRPGDRVVSMAPSHFQTYRTVPDWTCHRLLEHESFDECATLPVVFATAIYGLHYRAQIKAGESILIHSGAGGVGIAAIQLALNAGVGQIFTTVSSEEKKQYLIDQFGLEPSNIFSSRDSSFLDGVLAATGGKGVDVVLNSLTGDQLHASWKCCASFGRFVEIGKLDLTTAGRLQMDQFLRNTTFTAVDLSQLYYTDVKGLHAEWKQLVGEVMTLYREGKITPPGPIKRFDISETTQAFRYFSSRSRMGKVVINFERDDAEIQVQPRKHTAQFSPHKSYIMVGCFGGLGRTLARWMASRGARKFAFLGRTGTDRLTARELVQDLEALGAECRVVRGDICTAAHVESVTSAAASLGPIGGVVQAAMGLNEALFSVMSNTFWHTGIDPKVHGTWHLHENIQKHGGASSLDFFLLTSSVSGSVGTATEGNYCAANHFLDRFARHMRSEGCPAVAVGLGMISEVGYLHDNPEIEALLLRRGIQTIDADELIQLIDLAISSSSAMGIPHAHDALAASHLLTGLEAAGLKELRRKGFEGSHPALEDPRAKLLINSFNGGSGDGSDQAGADAGGLPAAVVALMQAGESLEEAVLVHIRRRFGNLVLLKYDDVDTRKPLAQYGMDSMIGAEFRTWFYQSLAVDVPLVLLLGTSCTLESLRDLALVNLEQGRD